VSKEYNEELSAYMKRYMVRTGQVDVEAIKGQYADDHGQVPNIFKLRRLMQLAQKEP